MDIDEQYKIIISNSLEDAKTAPETHLIEEMAELTKEIAKRLRGKENNILEEMADVFFQINKILKPLGLTERELKISSIHKTKMKFPEQMNKRGE